jgi:hypothetical protein
VQSFPRSSTTGNPAEVYEKPAGFKEMVIDGEELGKRFREARRLLDLHSHAD